MNRGPTVWLALAALLVGCASEPPARSPARGATAAPAPVNSSIYLDVVVGPDFERDPAPVLSVLAAWLGREGVVINDSRYRASKVVRVELLQDWVWEEADGSFAAEAIAVVSETWPIPRPRWRHEEPPARIARAGVGGELEYSRPVETAAVRSCESRDAADQLVVERLGARLGECLLLRHYYEWVPRPLSPAAMTWLRGHDPALADLVERDPGLQRLFEVQRHPAQEHPSYAHLEPAQRSAIARLNGWDLYDTLMEERPILHHLDPWQFLRTSGEGGGWLSSAKESLVPLDLQVEWDTAALCYVVVPPESR